jgi:hypothetical protein
MGMQLWPASIMHVCMLVTGEASAALKGAWIVSTYRNLKNMSELLCPKWMLVIACNLNHFAGGSRLNRAQSPILRPASFCLASIVFLPSSQELQEKCKLAIYVDHQVAQACL